MTDRRATQLAWAATLTFTVAFWTGVALLIAHLT